VQNIGGPREICFLGGDRKCIDGAQRNIIYHLL